MELLKNKEFKGLSFEITSEGFDNNWNGRYSINLRITNLNDKKKMVEINARYISVEHGLLDVASVLPYGLKSDGRFLQPHSFVNSQLLFEQIEKSYDGDRIELDINEGNIASLLLTRENANWYIIDYKGNADIKNYLKNRIEHFENIEEKFGLTLQKFSVRIIDKKSLCLYGEVLALNGEIRQDRFNIDIAVYDTDDNIVYHNNIMWFNGDFKGFEVFNFGQITLDIPIEEIGKIRIYPTL